MPVGSPRSAVTLEELTQTCEKFWSAQGFVKWADVAEVYGVSRQAVHNRLKAAVEKGEIDAATFLRWSSPSSRAAASRERREASRERAKQIITIQLTPENARWLREECAVRGVKSPDIVNGLLNKARLSK